MSSTTKAEYRIFPIITSIGDPLRTVNFYLISINNELFLFDTGWEGPYFQERLEQILEKNGYGITDISAVIISHHHEDHCGLAQKLAEEFDIPLYADPKAFLRLQREENFMADRIQFFKKLYQKFGSEELGEQQTKKLENSLKLNRDKGIQAPLRSIHDLNIDPFKIISTPGHAPDQIGLWDPKYRSFLGADALIEHISSNAFVEPDENGQRLYSLLQNIRTLKKLQSLSIYSVYPGHGDIIYKPNLLIEQRLSRIEQKGTKIINLIRQGCQTGDAIAKNYYKDIYHQQFSLVVSEIMGQLDYLEYQGYITKHLKQGVYHYEVTAATPL